MIYVAIAALVGATLVSLAALHAVGQLVRSHARERNLMLNQLLHLAGRTWEPPPAEPTAVAVEEEYEERYTTSVPGMPDFYEGRFEQ